MTSKRNNPIDLNSEEFRKIGHQLIDDISDFIDSIDRKPVTTNESPSQLQGILKKTSLPEHGMSSAELISKATDLLLNHSLLNGHPKFLGYITSSAAPIGALGDLLAASINPNVGAHILSPMATEIEKQTVQWLAEFIGVSPSYGGILVSGGTWRISQLFWPPQLLDLLNPLRKRDYPPFLKNKLFIAREPHILG